MRALATPQARAFGAALAAVRPGESSEMRCKRPNWSDAGATVCRWLHRFSQTVPTVQGRSVGSR
jgi:hypothetical protein